MLEIFGYRLEGEMLQCTTLLQHMVIAVGGAGRQGCEWPCDILDFPAGLVIDPARFCSFTVGHTYPMQAMYIFPFTNFSGL